MMMILRAILALIVDLVVCYLCGEFILHNFYKKIYYKFTCVIVGFLVCQIVFEVITLGSYFMEKDLATVTRVWLCVIVLLCLLGGVTLVRSRENAKLQLKIEYINWMPCIIAAITVLAFCYYVSINGETNEDSRYYVSLVNTTLNTGTLFLYNPYNGMWGDSWYLRRALATYEIHSAMLCSVFQIPALVVTRITRACENVILSSMTVYLLGKKMLWRKEEDGVKEKKACYLVVLYLFLQLVYTNTYPSSAFFFLFRAYEGKAFSANLLVLFTMYLCAEFMLVKQKRYLGLLIIGLWGAAAISSSGMIVVGMEIGIFMGAYIIWDMVERFKGRKYE